MNLLDDILNEITATPTQKNTTELIFSVAEFSQILKGTLEDTFNKIKIKGEIQGLKKHSSGTYYFDLKESQNGKDYILNAVLWKWTKLTTPIEEGQEVIVSGKITAYTGRSSYQITVENIEIAGIGALLKMIEERKEKLKTEGLFDPIHKKPIPKFPKIIGVITSPTGAVIRDIIHRISDRFPTHIIVNPSPVQGDGCEKNIIKAIQDFNKMSTPPDVIIIARGGGSIQDLMPFNDEGLVRAVFASTIPIISAIGHETDTTLIDYVSDLRAPTPTAAAELATPVLSEVKLNLSKINTNLLNRILMTIEKYELRIQSLGAKIKNPLQVITETWQRIDEKIQHANVYVKNLITNKMQNINLLGTMLESLSFKNVLNRGYSIVWNKTEIITSKATLEKLNLAIIEFHDGKTEMFTTKPQSKPTDKVKEKSPPQTTQQDLF